MTVLGSAGESWWEPALEEEQQLRRKLARFKGELEGKVDQLSVFDVGGKGEAESPGDSQVAVLAEECGGSRSPTRSVESTGDPVSGRSSVALGLSSWQCLGSIQEIVLTFHLYHQVS